MLVTHSSPAGSVRCWVLLGVVLGVNQVALGLQLMLCGPSGVIAKAPSRRRQPTRTRDHELIGS
jgi:hypothetical protein